MLNKERHLGRAGKERTPQSQNTRKRTGDKSEKNFSLCKFVRERTNLCDAQKGVREWRIKDENNNETNK